MKDYSRKCLHIDLEVDAIMQETKNRIYKEYSEGDSVIYAIRCKQNNRMYIGCTFIQMAEANFKRLLMDAPKEKYSNVLMQRDFNLYGRDSFELIILDKCSGSGRDEDKQKYIDKFGGLGSKRIYNLTDTIHRSVSYFNTISNELKEL